MKKKFSRSRWLVVFPIAVNVGGYVSIDEKELSILEGGVGVSEVGFTPPERLHLGPVENNACLKLVFNKIIVIGIPIIANNLEPWFSHGFMMT